MDPNLIIQEENLVTYQLLQLIIFDDTYVISNHVPRNHLNDLSAGWLVCSIAWCRFLPRDESRVWIRTCGPSSKNLSQSARPAAARW